MPNPKLETYKNKATGDVYDYTDADAQGKLTAILDGTTIDSFADVESALGDKVDAVAGKGLSTNDYDDTEKAKVAAAFPRSEQAVLGAKNVAIGTFSSSSIEGIAYTANSDNTIGVVAGSTHAQHQVNSTPFIAPVSGMFKYLGGIANEAVVFCWDNTSNSRPYTSPSKTTAQSNNSKGKEDAIPFYMEEGHVYQLICRVGANVEVTGTFYPMIICETDTDLSYAPPAMTNKELTDRVDNIKYTSNGTSYTVLKQYVVKPTITFSSGVGTATLYAPAGETIGSFAVACANSDKAVAHVNVSGTTATVTLTDTSYSSTAPVTIIYFTYKS